LAVANAKRDLIHVWDTDSGKERCALRLEKGANACSLALCSDGSKLLCGTKKAVQMWDLATGKMLYTVKSELTYPCPVFTADQNRFAVPDSPDTICFRESATGRELGRMRDKRLFGASWGVPYGGLSFCLSSDGKTLATGEYHTGAILLFDVATGKQKPAAEGQRGRPHGAFSPDGQRLVTGGSNDGTIHLWNLATSKSLLHIDHWPNWVSSVAFSADGRSVFSTWDDENLWINDSVTGERRHVIKLEDPERPSTYQNALCRPMQLSTDGKRLVAFSFYNPSCDEMLITGWDAATHKQLFRRRRPAPKSWTALSADARTLAAASPGAQSPGPGPLPPGVEPEKGPDMGPMQLEDVATGERLLTFPVLEGHTWPQAFSPDGRLLTANNYNHKVSTKLENGKPAYTATESLRVFETATAAELLTLPTASNVPFETSIRPAFSADGRLLAVAAPEQEILVLDLRHGRELRRFKGLDAAVTWLAFAPDGRRLVSGLNDSTLLVWDVSAREASPPIKLGAEGLAKAWADLGTTDAPKAFRARVALASSPDESIALLKDRLKPAKPADPQRLRALLTDLDSAEFKVREKAQTELEVLGDLAAPALRQALADKPTLEVQRRVQSILKRLRGPVRRADILQAVRAVAVLEDIATPEARQVLETLSKGAPTARQTQESRAALERLSQRSP
jgi:WD40 repeat protein